MIGDIEKKGWAGVGGHAMEAILRSSKVHHSSSRTSCRNLVPCENIGWNIPEVSDENLTQTMLCAVTHTFFNCFMGRRRW